VKLFADFLSLPGHRRILALALAVSLTMIGALFIMLWFEPTGAPPLVVGCLVALGLLLTWAQFHNFVGHLMEREYERQALEQSEGAMREALQALPLGVAVYDSHDRLMFYNTQAAEMAPLRFGEELVGQTFEAPAQAGGPPGQILLFVIPRSPDCACTATRSMRAARSASSRPSWARSPSAASAARSTNTSP